MDLSKSDSPFPQFGKVAMSADALADFLGDIDAIGTSAAALEAEEKNHLAAHTTRTSKKRKADKEDNAKPPTTKKRKVIVSAPMSTVKPTIKSKAAWATTVASGPVADQAKSAAHAYSSTPVGVTSIMTAATTNTHTNAAAASSSSSSSVLKQVSSGIVSSSTASALMKAHNQAMPQYASHWYEGTDRQLSVSSNQRTNVRGKPVGGSKEKTKRSDAWPENDFRIFVGNLGSEVNDVTLNSAFASKYGSVAMSKVMRDKKSGKSKGFGFVSFLDFKECADALRTMAGKYIGTRPIMLKVSTKNKNMRNRKKKGKHFQRQRGGHQQRR